MVPLGRRGPRAREGGRARILSPSLPMPTTIGHALGGVAAAEVSADGRRPRPWVFVILAVVVANLPDLDFVPGALLGHAERFHRGASHSVFAAMATAAVLGPIGARFLGVSVRRSMGFFFLVYASHLVLDVLMRDPTGGPGIAALWPLTDARYSLNLPWQHALDPIRTLDPGFFRDGIVGGVLSIRTVRVFIVDGLLVAPLVPLALWIRGRMGSPNPCPEGGLPAPDPHPNVIDEVLAGERGRPPDPEAQPQAAGVGAGT